jgi:hypothetical protein
MPRHALGALLAEQGRHEEAIEVFQTDLSGFGGRPVCEPTPLSCPASPSAGRAEWRSSPHADHSIISIRKYSRGCAVAPERCNLKFTGLAQNLQAGPAA